MTDADHERMGDQWGGRKWGSHRRVIFRALKRNSFIMNVGRLFVENRDV